MTSWNRVPDDVPLEELLVGVTATPAEPPSPVGVWIEDEGYFPGTTRVTAAELYRRYTAWRAAHPEIDSPIEGIRMFGKQLVKQFRCGRGKHGTYYWISRS